MRLAHDRHHRDLPPEHEHIPRIPHARRPTHPTRRPDRLGPQRTPQPIPPLLGHGTQDIHQPRHSLHLVLFPILLAQRIEVDFPFLVWVADGIDEVTDDGGAREQIRFCLIGLCDGHAGVRLSASWWMSCG